MGGRRPFGGRVAGYARCGRPVGPGRYRAGAGMVRLGVPGRDADDLPADEAVGIALPGQGWADLALSAADAVPRPGGRPRARPAAGVVAEVRALVAASPVPVVIDADGLFALGTARRPASSRPARRRCSPPTTASTPASRRPPGPDRIDAARRLAAASARGGPGQGSDHRRRRPVGRGPAGPLRHPGAGHGRDGRRAVRSHRRTPGPRVPPLEAAALGAHLHGRAGALGHRGGTGGRRSPGPRGPGAGRRRRA